MDSRRDLAAREALPQAGEHRDSTRPDFKPPADIDAKGELEKNRFVLLNPVVGATLPENPDGDAD